MIIDVQETVRVADDQGTPSSPTPTVGVPEFFLELHSPESVESVVTEASITIRGRTRVDAVVTVNDHVLEPDIDGRFEQDVRLEPGVNIVEVVASLATGEEKALVVTLIYLQ